MSAFDIVVNDGLWFDGTGGLQVCVVISEFETAWSRRCPRRASRSGRTQK